MITPEQVRVYVACTRKDGRREKLRLWYNGSYLRPADGDIWVVPSDDHIYHVTRIEADESTRIVTDVRVEDSRGIKRWDMRQPRYCRDWLPAVMPGDTVILPPSISTRGILTDMMRRRALNFIFKHNKNHKLASEYTDDELCEALRDMREVYN